MSPSSLTSAPLGGRCYHISFTDDKTRLTYLRLLHQKSKARTAYKGFEAWFRTQHDARVKVLHSDRANEYLGQEVVMHPSQRVLNKMVLRSVSTEPCWRRSAPCCTRDYVMYNVGKASQST
jgi:hypothetical protein